MEDFSNNLNRRYKPMTEYGRIGQNRYAGVFMEEFRTELQGQRGVEVYKEMETDDIISAMLFAVEMLIRQSEFNIEPAGDNAKDKEAAEFIDQCLHDMSQTWADTLSEILSFLVFGWSYHEINYKRRMGKHKDPCLNSKYDDGLIGWKSLPIRSQNTLWRWEYNEHDDLLGMSQMAPPDYAIRFIPIEKALHFITKSRKWNPEGRSMLRGAYESYYFKRRMKEIEGIGVERDLAGLPMLQPPENVDLWDSSDPEMVRQLAYAERLVQNVRRDATEGVVIPFGWEFTLLNGGSRRQFEIGSVIERYDRRIAMTVMADFILLGSSSVGSFALSSDKTELFAVALGTYLDIICEVFNTQAIPRLIDLNGDHFKGITDYPKMVHGDVEGADLDKLGAFIEKMVGVGLLVPDENLERYVRTAANLPEKVEGDPEISMEERMKLVGYGQDEEEQQGGSEGTQKPQKKPAKGNASAGQKKPSEKRTEGDKKQSELREKMAKAWGALD